MGGITVNHGRTKPPHLIAQAKRLRQEGKSIDEIKAITGLKRTLISEVTRAFYNARPIRTCQFCKEDFVANSCKAQYCSSYHASIAKQYRDRGWDYSTYPHTPGKNYTQEQIAYAIELRTAGMELEDVVAIVGVSETTLRRRGLGDITWVKNCEKCGEPFKTKIHRQKNCDEHKQRNWRAQQVPY